MRDSRFFLLEKLPAVQFENKILYSSGTNEDIQQALRSATAKAVEMVKPIAGYFREATAEATAKKIHTFIRKNLSYRKDPAGLQQIKLPNRYLLESGDCKSKSLFVFSILKALGFDPVYKLANYEATKGNIPSHVYVILRTPGKNISIDGTYKYFNKEPKTHFSKIMEIQELSANLSSGTLRRIKLSSAQKATARRNFLKSRSAKNKFLQLSPKTQQAFLQKISAEADTIEGRKLKAAVKKAAGKVKSTAKKAAGKVVSVGKKAVQVTKTAGLSIPRNAFIGLVLLNVKSFATKLSNKKGDKLKKLWVSLGGDYSKLVKAIDSGKNKKPIGEEADTIGEPVTITLATAAPIIAKMVSFLGSEKGKAISKTVAKVSSSKAVKSVQKVLKDNPALKAKLSSVGKKKAEQILNKAVTKATGSTAAGSSAAQSFTSSMVPGTSASSFAVPNKAEEETFEKTSEQPTKAASSKLPLLLLAAAGVYAATR